MNIAILSTNLSPLLECMEVQGYSARKRHFVNKMANEIVKLSSPPQLSSYDDYFERFVKPKYPTRSEKNISMQKGLVLIIERYAEHGIFPEEIAKPAVFTAYYDRIPLHSEFMSIINLTRKKFESRNLGKNTIQSYTAALSSFLFYQYDKGNTHICDIKEITTLAYFNEPKVHRGYSQMAHIRSCLLEIQNEYPICKQILAFLPKFNPRKKVYPYLQDFEFRKLLDYTMDTSNVMSYRDRAIILLAMFTGLRGCDIARLRFSDINWENCIISLCQKKTGKEVSLPLRPIIGNAIWDYIEYERQDFKSEFIFLSRCGKIKPISLSSIQHLVESLFKRVDLRQDGTLVGLHLFRHNLATSMLAEGVDVPIITDMLGHDSAVSLDPYISAEHKHLKKCALSIERYPIAKGVLEL